MATNLINLGSTKIDNLYVGSTEVDKVYLGTTLIYEKSYDPYSNYLTFEILSAGTINWRRESANVAAKTIQYSKNGGSWTSITSSTSPVTISVSSGDVLRFKGNNTAYGALDSNTTLRTSSFSGSTATFNVKGNIMSMISGDSFTNVVTLPNVNYTFPYFFATCKIVKASELVLPATTIRQQSYQSMFRSCSSMTETIEILPATTLTQSCYSSMFYGCSNLLRAPILPAKSISNYGYQSLFYNCSKLNYIRCLATNRTGTGALTNWVNGVASSGTFERGDSSWTQRGVSQIPSGWTIVNV